MAVHNSPNEEYAEVLQSSKMDKRKRKTAGMLSEVDISLMRIEAPYSACPYKFLHTTKCTWSILTL